MLLGDFAEAAPEAGLELAVTSLAPFAGEPAARRLETLGIAPQHVAVRGLIDPRSVRALRRRLAATAPDIVHTHLDYADVLGGAAARTLGVPSVATLHVMRWAAAGARERARLELFGRVRRRTARRVIAVSAAARAAYLEHGWDTPARVVSVHNGIARSSRRGAGAAVRAGLGIAPDALVVTMLSVLRGGKGHDEALEAFATLRERFPAARLVIAGTGPDEERLRTAAGDGVVFAGHRDDVMELLDASDVLLHPSHVDAFPTALLEALAAGVPVVATAVGGIAEIVEDRETGLLVAAPPRVAALEAALSELLGDAALRARLGAAGAASFAARFTARRWVAELAALYAAVSSSRSKTSAT